MDAIAPVGPETPKKGIGASVDASPPAVRRESAFSGTGSEVGSLPPPVVADVSCTISNRAGYSEDTCVLTENGWKLHSEVGKNERIMVFDPFTNTMWYEVPKELLSYDYHGKMVSFRTKLVDILVTPEHRIAYKPSMRLLEKRPWRFATAWQLTGKRANIPAIATWRGGEDSEFVQVPEFWKRNGSIGPRLLPPVRIPMDTWLELAGYYLSEGGMDTKNHYSFSLAQAKRKGENIAKIQGVLSRIPFHSHEYADSKAIKWNVGNKQLCEFVVKCFGEGAANKHIPSELKNLPKTRLKILLDAVLLGDGTWGDGRFIRLSTISRQLAYDLEELAVKLGCSTNVRIAYQGSGNRSTMYDVTFRLARYHDVQNDRITTLNYDGIVCCFSTSTGFCVTMRNGKIAF